MTYKEIAEKCGVSLSTVSRALNGKSGVNENLRSRIYSLAEQEKKTEPDIIVSGMTGKKRTGRRSGEKYIGVIFRGEHNYFLLEVGGAIYDALKPYGYSLGVFKIESDGDEIDKAVSLEKEDRLAGLILLGGRYDYSPEEIKRITVPFVMCTYTNRFGTLSADSYSSVSCDDYMTGYSATEVLLKAGHKRIGAIFPATNDRSVSALRYSGFCAALADNGIEQNDELIVISESYETEAAYQSTRRLIRMGAEMSAIVTVSDAMALGAIKALADSGIKVPHDISLISIDGLSFTRYTVPTLTTMAQPVKELGQESVRQLISLINGGKHCQKTLEVHLRPGGTVRKNRE